MDGLYFYLYLYPFLQNLEKLNKTVLTPLKSSSNGILQ
jgi:hypothetical protein